MSLHSDEHFLAAVAAALGESVGLVRRRGFHLETATDDPAPRHSNRVARTPTARDDDPIDMATLGIDWDSHDDSRLHRRCRKPLTLPTARTRRSRRAASLKQETFSIHRWRGDGGRGLPPTPSVVSHCHETTIHTEAIDDDQETDHRAGGHRRYDRDGATARSPGRRPPGAGGHDRDARQARAGGSRTGAAA